MCLCVDAQTCKFFRLFPSSTFAVSTLSDLFLLCRLYCLFPSSCCHPRLCVRRTLHYFIRTPRLPRLRL
ncbi:hypothetical protein ACTXT7_004260 [Hymenolepis weldensis]